MASQQRITAAEQLWEALHESEALAASLKAPWTAVDACQQLAELLDTVSALLSRVFSEYRDKLFIDGLNTHLQSSGTAHRPPQSFMACRQTQLAASTRALLERTVGLLSSMPQT